MHQVKGMDGAIFRVPDSHAADHGQEQGERRRSQYFRGNLVPSSTVRFGRGMSALLDRMLIFGVRHHMRRGKLNNLLAPKRGHRKRRSMEIHHFEGKAWTI